MEWRPADLPERGRELARPPRTWEEFADDMRAYARRTAGEAGGRALIGEVVSGDGADFRDHAGEHRWDGTVVLGEDVPRPALRRRGEGEGRRAERGAARARLGRDRGRPPRGPARRQPLGQERYAESWQANLWEALVEELAQADSARVLSRQGQDDVVRWAADHPTSFKRLGTYRPERAALADLLDRAAVPPEEREDFLRRLLLRVPAEDRDAELARRIGGEDAEARVRRALASPDPKLTFAPILTPDAEPSGAPARPFVVAGEALKVGDLVRARRPGGEVEAGEVEDLRPGDPGLPWTATVRFVGGDVDRAVAPSQIADVGRREGAGIDARRSFGVEAPSASVAGVELRPGDRVSWDSGAGRRTRARVVRVVRDRDPNADGESWLVEALTEPREGRPATRVLLAPGRAKSLQTEGRPDAQRPPRGGRVDGPPRGLPSPPTLERRARLLRHFDVPPEALVVPTSSLLPSRVDAPEKVSRAAALMADAAGGGPRRAPLLVRPQGDGTFRVLDGNATLAAAERVGLSELPVVLERGGARSPSSDPLEAIAARHPEVELDAFERHDQGIVISLIRVPEGRRNRGLATAALKDVLAYADATGQTVAVTPDPIVRTPGGLSKSRLTAWYASHGFRSNKGRKIDFRFRETMVRDPQGPSGARRPAAPATLPDDADVRSALEAKVGGFETRVASITRAGPSARREPMVERMQRQKLTNLPVTTSDGRLVGLLTLRDAEQARSGLGE